MHPLAQLLMLPDARYVFSGPSGPTLTSLERCSADYFVSVSETDEEISLILPKEFVADLPAGPLKVDPQTVWRAVEVLEGSLGFCTPIPPLLYPVM